MYIYIVASGLVVAACAPAAPGSVGVKAAYYPTTLPLLYMYYNI